MARYETVCVIKSDVQADRLNKITEKVTKVLTDHKIDNLNKQEWGIRKLAYPIQNFKTAHYLYYTYEGVGNIVSELERQLNYDDAILRYLTIKLDKNSRTDVMPDTFQLIRSEPEGYSHPFGGGSYERRERFDRRGPDRSDRPERKETREES